MGKKFIIYLLGLLLLVSGCSGNENGMETKPQDIPEPAPLKYSPGELSYYVNLPQNHHWQLYPDMCASVSCMVLADHEMDTFIPGSIGQNIFFESGCISEFAPWKEDSVTEYPFYLYQTYRGIDWEQMAALSASAKAGDPAAQEKLEYYSQLFREDYEALTPDDLPSVYAYRLTMLTSNARDGAGRFKTMELTLEQKTISVLLGVLDIHTTSLLNDLPSVDKELPQSRLPAAEASFWSDLAELPEIRVSAEDFEQVWTKAAYLGADAALENIHVALTKAGITHTVDWDGDSPLSIPAGYEAHLSAKLHHNGKGVMGYCGDGFLVIERNAINEKQRLWYPISITQKWNMYELYAAVVDGVDLSPYYAYAEGYESPEPHPEKATQIPEGFQAVSILQNHLCNLRAVGVETDDFAYTLRLTAQNFTDHVIEFDLRKWQFNGYSYDGNFSFTLSPKETAEIEFALPWEKLRQCRVTENSPRAIHTVVATCATGMDGSWQQVALTPLYPMGKENSSPVRIPVPNETPLLDESDFYVAFSGSEPKLNNIFSNAIGGETYCTQLHLENRSSRMLTFQVIGGTINGADVPASGLQSLPSGGLALWDIEIPWPETSNMNAVNEITLNIKVWTDGTLDLENPDAVAYWQGTVSIYPQPQR